jgi:hypothetical protein
VRLLPGLRFLELRFLELGALDVRRRSAAKKRQDEEDGRELAQASHSANALTPRRSRPYPLYL